MNEHYHRVNTKFDDDQYEKLKALGKHWDCFLEEAVRRSAVTAASFVNEWNRPDMDVYNETEDDYVSPEPTRTITMTVKQRLVGRLPLPRYESDAAE